MACDDHTLNAKQLKAFRVTKRVAGRDVKAFEDAIRKVVEELYPTSSGAKPILLLLLLIFTGVFTIVLPAAWLLRYFKGARYNTVGAVWQLSQWEDVPVDEFYPIQEVQQSLLEKERQEAARAGASWALGQHLSEHLPRMERRTFNPLGGHETFTHI
ncbi:unnamed protein product [Tilletia controversa]|nr:unnamed protein product [Tilletia caries]CAD6922007.1 unnamed protein product [Tilletia controversa]CAD6922129.1 unnamed protein product [Tilletia controversa]CAD6957562.1 unnamed protein product [Tilletia laevis]